MVIAYLRVGTSNERFLEEQKDEIKRYALDHNMNVDKWVTDVIAGKERGIGHNLAMVLDCMQEGDNWSCRIFPVWDELCRKS